MVHLSISWHSELTSFLTKNEISSLHDFFKTLFNCFCFLFKKIDKNQQNDLRPLNALPLSENSLLDGYKAHQAKMLTSWHLFIKNMKKKHLKEGKDV